MELLLTAVAFDSFESWLYVVLALLAVIWVVVAGVVVQRYRKGKLVIRVLKARLGRGREITGVIKVLAYQPIAGQELKISLVAKAECEVESGSAGGGTSTISKEVFRKDLTVTGQRDYQAGQKKEFKFAIPSPTVNEANSLIDRCGRSSFLLGSNTGKIRWFLDARLCATGVDLTKTKVISGLRPVKEEMRWATDGRD